MKITIEKIDEGIGSVSHLGRTVIRPAFSVKVSLQDIPMMDKDKWDEIREAIDRVVSIMNRIEL